MFKGLFAEYRTEAKLLLLTGFVVIGMLLGAIVTKPFITDDIFSIRWSQFVMSFFAFICPALACAFLFKENKKLYWNWKNIPTFSLILLTGLSVFFLLPFVNFTAWLNNEIHFPQVLSELENTLRTTGEESNQLIEKLIITNSKSDLLQNLIVLGIMPAISEELLFRGTLQKTLSNRLNLHSAVWITAIIFSIVHFDIFGFVPRVLLGAFLGYLFVWSGSLYLPMIAHFTHNAISIFAGYIIGCQATETKIDEIGVGDMWFVAVISLLVSLVIIWRIRKEITLFTSKNDNTIL